MRGWWEEWKIGFLVLAVSAAMFTGFWLFGVWFFAAATAAFYACATLAWLRRRYR